jgi:hypothetical protein
MTLVRWFVLVTSLGFFLPGCSHKPQAEAPAEFMLLQEVNELLHLTTKGGRPPTKLADLSREQQSMFPRAYEAVKSGNVVVLWGAPPKGEGDVGKDETVLAYEKNVPTEGGHVLFSAGTVKKMTAADFNAAPKAKK